MASFLLWQQMQWNLYSFKGIFFQELNLNFLDSVIFGIYLKVTFLFRFGIGFGHNSKYDSDSTFVYKLKMEYGWNCWLKVSYIISTYTRNSFFKSLHAERRWFLLLNLQFLCKSPHFYAVKWIRRKWLSNEGIPKKNLDPFSPSF